MLIVRGNSPVLGMDNHPVGHVPGMHTPPKSAGRTIAVLAMATKSCMFDPTEVVHTSPRAKSTKATNSHTGSCIVTNGSRKAAAWCESSCANQLDCDSSRVLEDDGIITAFHRPLSSWCHK